MKALFTGITRLSVRFKWVTILVAVLLLVAGVYAATQMRQELLPNISFPQSFILVFRPGASSEDMRDLVTIPLENEAVKIKGVIPAGLESSTAGPVAFLTVRSEYGSNLTQIGDDLKAAINRVNDAGVPLNLKTTADLTPDVMKKVLTQAPSMWDHFESQQLLAMSPEVLDTALSVNPAFASKLDRLTVDQLAAERLDAAMNGTALTPKPADLPGAWVLTEKQLPQILNFSLSDLPIISASVFSKSADLTPQQLEDLVNNELVTPLTKGNLVDGVADVKVSGGQLIPPTVHDSAVAAVDKARTQANTPAQTDSNSGSTGANTQPTTNNTQPATTNTQTQPTPPAAPVDENGVPLLPPSWTALLIRLALRVPLHTADDLFNVKDQSGNPQTVAQTVNQLAGTNPEIIPDLNPAIIKYIAQKESDFAAKLSDQALALLSPEAYATAKNEKVAPPLSTDWTELASQPGFKALNLNSVRALRNAKGGAAAMLNALVKNTPASMQPFAIRLISSLGPDAIDYLTTYDSSFLSKLDPQVLRYFSAESLKTVAAFVDSLSDAQLKADLKAIIADPSKAAVAALPNTSAGAEVADDPNAPPLPNSWTTSLKPFGVTAVKANDLLKKPFGMSAGVFINTLAQRGPQMAAELSPDVLLYLQAHDKTFFDTLAPVTIAALSKDTLAKLPPEVQDRASSGTPFIPATTVTRTNGQAALTVTIYKKSAMNTVEVSDKVEEALAKFQAQHPNVGIETAFEQASFIKESIGGVAREGGLGAVMAVIVILLFLNFSVRSTLVTAVSIPTSIAIAFILMNGLPSHVHEFLINPAVSKALPEALMTFLTRLFPESITLNIMTLSGLTVAIGRVVDDAIVVLENIYRHIQNGDAPFEAVVTGTRDVSLAIFAATLTTVVVFLPIGLAGGIIGEFFLPFGLAVTYSLIASFIVAITIVPTLAFMFVRRKEVQGQHEGRLESVYHGLIEWALSHRVAVLGMALLTLALGIALFATRPTSFLPALGEPQITVAVAMPSGTPIAQTDVRVQDLEKYLETLRSSGVTKYQVVIGSGGGLASFAGGGTIDGTAAQITIAAHGKDADGLTNLTAQIRAQAETIFGAPKNVKVSKGSLSDQGFGGFAVQVTGPQEELSKINDQIIAELSKVPGLANVSSSLNLVAAAGASKSYIRVDQTPSVTFTAELETADTLGLTKTAIARVKAMPGLPADVTVGEGFQSQTQTEGFAQMVSSLGIAVIIVYLVMVITFGSLIHPFTILFSLPLAVVGAALALTLTNRVLGISAMIGLLMLVGIVVTNAIVLIDRVQANRKERGMSAREALIEGGRTRLRPILMTAIATMFALLPLAIGLSQGAIIASELGTVVIGGLFSSTLLTLLVVPVVYSLLDQAQRAVLRQKPIEAPSAASGD